MFLINGEPGDFLSVRDRGLHYGDGVFETIAVDKQQPLCWQKHIARLQLGCERLQIQCPGVALLEDEADRVCANTADRGVMKIIVTRGEGGRGYKTPDQPQTARLLALYPWPDYPVENASQGVRVRLCDTRLGRNPQLAGIKHLNRLEQVLARQEWDDPAIAEGLVSDTEDNIIEGTMSNLFVIQGRTLFTPAITHCGIAGIVRQCILESASEVDLNISIKELKYKDLVEADALFLCNSTIGLWPIKTLAENRYTLHPAIDRLRQLLIDRDLIVA